MILEKRGLSGLEVAKSCGLKNEIYPGSLNLNVNSAERGEGFFKARQTALASGHGRGQKNAPGRRRPTQAFILAVPDKALQTGI